MSWMNKILVLGVMSLLAIGGIALLSNVEEDNNSIEDEIYQGPVPSGYDLEYFRQTGETVKEGES